MFTLTEEKQDSPYLVSLLRACLLRDVEVRTGASSTCDVSERRRMSVPKKGSHQNMVVRPPSKQRNEGLPVYIFAMKVNCIPVTNWQNCHSTWRVLRHAFTVGKAIEPKFSLGKTAFFMPRPVNNVECLGTVSSIVEYTRFYLRFTRTNVFIRLSLPSVSCTDFSTCFRFDKRV